MQPPPSESPGEEVGVLDGEPRKETSAVVAAAVTERLLLAVLAFWLIVLFLFVGLHLATSFVPGDASRFWLAVACFAMSCTGFACILFKLTSDDLIRIVASVAPLVRPQAPDRTAPDSRPSPTTDVTRDLGQSPTDATTPERLPFAALLDRDTLPSMPPPDIRRPGARVRRPRQPTAPVDPSQPDIPTPTMGS